MWRGGGRFVGESVSGREGVDREGKNSSERRDKDQHGLEGGPIEIGRRQSGRVRSAGQVRVLQGTYEHSRIGGRPHGSIRALPPVYMRYG